MAVALLSRAANEIEELGGHGVPVFLHGVRVQEEMEPVGDLRALNQRTTDLDVEELFPGQRLFNTTAQ